ncbi:hypothetical protein [Rathayibacter sp. VKM Ac-2857]|uniref:hypothetical protein n=1 Tax=Rathayibacter sp. VKM Ac-2857 TaxID=2739020 RepID=UPI0015672A9F|nr:hypothetical protein [Rathayibacter sp. VKM Ac-2857]NQX17943.1 hypothetical protein [Rathayibacter sp. VKM Ac-2857]
MLPTPLPTPDLYLPAPGEPALRRGIVGPGRNAGTFAHALHAHPVQLGAVGAVRDEVAA